MARTFSGLPGSALEGAAQLLLERVEQAGLLRVEVAFCLCFEQVEHLEGVARETGIDRNVHPFGVPEVGERGAGEGDEEGREGDRQFSGHGRPYNEVLPAPAMLRLRVLLCVLALGAAAVLPRPALAAPAHTASAEDIYSLGLKFLRRGYYQKALEQFNRVRTFYRDDPYSLKAELAIADIHFKKNEWDEARLAYEDFKRAHPRYPELDLVVYRLGLVIYKKSPIIPDRDQTWTRQTVSVWAGFAAQFPESQYRPEVEKYLSKAQARLAKKELLIAQFYARRNSWPSVVGRVEPMLRAWPDSPDTGEALALYGRALHRLGNDDGARSVQDRKSVV